MKLQNRKNTDWIRSTLVCVVITLLWLMFAAAIAHCLDASPQTNQEILTIYIKRCNPQLPKILRRLIAEEVINQSMECGIPWEITAAIMKIESCYNPKAIGSLGEIGLMQIYTMRCGEVEFQTQYLEDIKYNIAAGLCIFCDKLQAANGDIFLAIERYNGSGPAAQRFRSMVICVIMELFKVRVSQNRRRIQNVKNTRVK